MFLKIQRNIFFQKIEEHNIPILFLSEIISDSNYTISTNNKRIGSYFFTVTPGAFKYNITMRPGVAEHFSSKYTDSWQEVVEYFNIWCMGVAIELETPDLWAEAAKTAQLFTGTTEASDDKFTRAELAEVQGQLRQLQQSFAAAALPEAARQKLIELTETAAVKAEGLTKKDWQNWIIGGFISAITSLMLNPTQAQEVLKLVKAAFGGLFLR